MPQRRWRSLLVLGAGCVMLRAAAPATAAAEFAPRAPRQDFIAPPAGSYRLPPIQRVPEGRVVDADGTQHPFSRYTRGRITVLSFFYTYCSDALGCPLAHATLSELRARLLTRPALARQLRFVSLSFDPTHDDPAALKLYAGALADPHSVLRWHFLSTPSVAALIPLLDGLGQDVAIETGPDGRPTRVRNHLLKLFLIDAEGRVREIYSSAYLLPEVMLNDIETLAQERTRH